MAAAMDASAKADLKFGEAAVTKAEAMASRRTTEDLSTKRKLEIDQARPGFEKESFEKKLKADEDKDKRGTGIRKAKLNVEAR